MKIWINVVSFAGCLSLVIATCGSLPSVAASINVMNHSFEEPDASGPGFVVGVPTGWTSSSGGTSGEFVELISSVGFSGGDAAQYAGADSAGNDDLYQDLGVSFQPNTTYTVDVATAHRSGFNHDRLEWGLYSSAAIGTALGTPGFADIQGVWTGSGNPDADDNFDALRDGATLAAIGTGALGAAYSFTTGSVAPAGNVVVYVRQIGTGARVNYDDVRVDATPIPEPSTIALVLSIGLFSGLRPTKQ